MPSTPFEAALSRLRMLVPHARFIQSGVVPAGRAEGEAAEQSFQYVSLYEHRIGNSIRPISGYTFILANGFLTSHAYNIALAWVWNHRGRDSTRLEAALRHNYKKFFAESVLARTNCLIGRAMLIETLIYEQDLMAPMFSAVASDPELKKLAEDIANATTRLASLHELAHYFLRRDEIGFRAHVAGLFGGTLGAVLDESAAKYGPGFAEELLCDAFAAHQAITSDEFPLGGRDLVTRARISAFAFLVFSDLISLEMSAVVTAAGCVDSSIDLASEKRSKTPVDFKVGRSALADARAAAIVDVLNGHLARAGNTLFGQEGPFPAPESTGGQLRNAFDRFADVIEPLDGGMTGTDLQRRGLAQLVAESLHEHPRGAEFLLWRSKRFNVGGKDIDP
jgi:hypothetical protein